MAHDEQDHIDGWQTYSEWIDNLRNTSDIIRKYDENSSFQQQMTSSSNNIDKFKLVWDNYELREEIGRIFKQDLTNHCDKVKHVQPQKSSIESKKKRDSGNDYFKKGKYMEALNQYTEAIKLAPYPEGESNEKSLALALANRSAALYSLTRYRLCLLDIDLAIKYGYPEENMFKLMIRKVKCLHVLSVWANDVEQIKEDLKCLLKNTSTKDYVKSEINSMFEFIEQTRPEDLEKDELDVVDETVMKISNASKSLTQAADCVEMSFDQDKGRYLIASKDISFGRLLLAEVPYVCILAPQNRQDYCYNCFDKLHSCGLSCPNCTQVLYCSEECIEAKSSIHRHECNKLLNFQDKLGVAYLPAHLMFKINFDLNSIPIYSRKTVENKSLDAILKMPSSDWPELVYKNDYAAVLSLVDHSSEFSYDSIMGYSITSAYLLHAILDQCSSPHFDLSMKENQLVIGSVILKHLFQLQTNLISILDQNIHEVMSVGHKLQDVKELPIGVGIYPTVSLLNHSCTPNIISIFHRNKFIARASKALECGTEINYCYGPHVNRMTKVDRQQRLREQYFFSCTCDSCTSNKENESRALLCSTCQGPVIYNLDHSNHCVNCGLKNKVDVKDYLSRIADLKVQFEQIKLDGEQNSKKIDKLHRIEKDLAKLIYWRNPLFIEIKTELIDCSEALEDLDLVLKYCKEELELCDRTYGKDSYESIMTMLKVINYSWQRLYFIAEESNDSRTKSDALADLRVLVTTAGLTKGKLKDLLASTNIPGAESSYDTEIKFLSDIQSNINRYLASEQTETQGGNLESNVTSIANN